MYNDSLNIPSMVEIMVGNKCSSNNIAERQDSVYS
jgi:hypothetical protein